MCDNNFMKKIAILGGTFNPVHSEHVELVKNAKQELGLDLVIVVPTYLPPHKNTLPAPAVDRINMLNLAFKEIDGVTVSDYEVKKQGKSYSYQTAEYFRGKYPDAEIYFLCGGDMLTDFKTWKNPERILKAVTLAVFDREDFYTDYDFEREYFKKQFNSTFIRLNYLGKDFSSTRIRVFASLGLSLEGLAIKQVEEYIFKNKLYSGDIYTEFLKKNLTQKRLIHTANVVSIALTKVKELGLDTQKVYLATLLHDCAKYLNKKDFPAFTLPEGVPPKVEHSFLGAYVAKNLLGISDEEVLDAINYHTSGKANMTTLGKLVFVADMVEEGRNYEGVERLRELYKKDFKKCFVECLSEEVLHLLNKKEYIYIETLNAYDFYVKKGEN